MMMDKHSFKIGDRVRVTRIETIIPWINGPKLIGATGIVSKVVMGRFTIAVEFEAERLKAILGDTYGGNIRYYFCESELEHVVKVGEQLMFDFMQTSD